MKKFLLPIAALMLGGAASAQSSQQVTVQYWVNGDVGSIPEKQFFEPTTNELLINEDGSFTLKNYQNSTYDLNFSIGKTTFNPYKGEGKYPEGVIGAPLLTFDATGYPTDADKNRYTSKLTTIAGLNANGVDLDQQEISFDLFIDKNSVAVLESDTEKATNYKIYLQNTFILPKIQPAYPYGAWLYGWSIFEMSIPKETTEQPEDPELTFGDYTVTYANFEQYNKVPYSATEKYQIAVVDDKNIVFKNFLGSGCDIPFTFSDPADVADKAYYAEGSLSVAQECVWEDKDDYVRVKGKGEDQPITAKLPNDMTMENPNVYTSGTFGGVKYYKEGDKTRRLIHLTIGAPWLTVEWNMIDGQVGDQSGIADVVVDENAPVEWYNLQGVRVNGDNLAPGIYIKRQGSKAVKVLVK